MAAGAATTYALPGAGRAFAIALSLRAIAAAADRTRQ